MSNQTSLSLAGPLAQEPRYITVGPTQVAYWVVGTGEPLLLVHGYPVSGRTWRHVVAGLADRFTCYVVDLAGAGETIWSEDTDFLFGAQALMLKGFVDALGLTSYCLMAHDTGATISRRLATLDTARIRRFLMIGTEIPGHRPSWIELFQKTANPRVTGVFRFLLGQRWFRHSSAGFGGCFQDKTLIEGEFKTLFVDPVVGSADRASGLIRYLLGIDWTVVDGMAQEHRRITMPTLLVWGENDPVFPVRDARPMVDQLANCWGFVTIPNAKLFIQEERPHEVASIARAFFDAGRREEMALPPAVALSTTSAPPTGSAGPGGSTSPTGPATRHSLIDGGGTVVMLLLFGLFGLPGWWLMPKLPPVAANGTSVFELRTLAWSAMLALTLPLLQIMLQITRHGGGAVRGNRVGFAGAVGAGGRVARAHANLTEALLPFSAVVLGVCLLGSSTMLTTAAAAVFLAARVVHAMTYTLGIPVIRSAAFYAGAISTVTIGVALLR